MSQSFEKKTIRFYQRTLLFLYDFSWTTFCLSSCHTDAILQIVSKEVLHSAFIVIKTEVVS